MPEPDSFRGSQENLRGKQVVLGVCGGIAAYKSVELLRLFTAADAHVSVVMTQAATNFVGAATYAALSDRQPVVGDLWGHPDPSPHTTLGRSADLVVVAPATARIVSDMATGRSGDALSATLLATKAPVVIAPAMHTEMWQHPAVRSNIETLRARGVAVVDPETGALAGGDFGEGRLASLDAIAEACAGACVRQTLAGKHFVVTAGGTREPIDAVRFIGNRSSGKQGHAVAIAAASRGARVTLVTTTPFAATDLIEVVSVETALEMEAAVTSLAADADAVVMAAAVADFRPVRVVANKLKKSDGPPNLTLEPNPDILQGLAATPVDGRIVVGFAAETDDLIPNARDKMTLKRLDVVVANDVSAGAGFDQGTNNATIIDRHGNEYTTGLVDKRTVADNLMGVIERLIESGST